MASPIEEVNECLRNKSNFLLSGGAGSGKTHTLVQTINNIFSRDPRSRVACITYTEVAAKEIESRVPVSELLVSTTIHSFLWKELNSYQKNIKEALRDLLLNKCIEVNRGQDVKSVIKKLENVDSVKYLDYKDIESGVISHDEIIKIARHMFSRYPLLSRILCDKYNYILVDEYQDTQEAVIEILLKHIKDSAKGKLCVGFFGDSMQSIYNQGIGNLHKYVEQGRIKEIIKEDNYRCSQEVINVINSIRNDNIIQKPSNRDSGGHILNNSGSVKFLFSDQDFDLQKIKENGYMKEWNLSNSENTKILFLTHKLNAKYCGFSNLLGAYKGHNELLIGDNADPLANLMFTIGEILCAYEEKDYATVLAKIEYRIEHNKDKEYINDHLNTLNTLVDSVTIGEVLDYADNNKILTTRPIIDGYSSKYNARYEAISVLEAQQIKAYYNYRNKYSPFSTQHGVKGEEYDNVIVVLDNGNWNQYSFYKYLEHPDSNDDTITNRTRKILYVCCSRAKNNLIVYCKAPSEKMLGGAKKIFGKDNTVNLA